MASNVKRRNKPSLQGLVVPPNKELDSGTKEQVLEAFRSGTPFDHYLFGHLRSVVVSDYTPGDLIKISFNRLSKAVFYRVAYIDVYGE